MKRAKTLFLVAALVSCAMVASIAVPEKVAAATWSVNKRVNEFSMAQQLAPRVAVTPDGTIHAVWADNRNSSQNSDIFYSYSSNNGTTFYKPDIEVSRQGGSPVTQGLPDIAPADNNSVVVAWQESSAYDTNVKVARKEAGQVNFTGRGVINSWTQGSQERPSIAARGTTVAVAWKDGRSMNQVRLWNSTTGALVRDFTGHTASVTAVSFSPDGTKLASSSEDGLVKVWDVASGNLLRNLTGHGGIVTCVAWSPDGTKIASGGTDGTVRVWFATNYTLFKTYTNSGNAVTCIDWSPNGLKIAVGSLGLFDASGINSFPVSDFNLTIWNVTSGVKSMIGTHAYSLTSVKFNSAGTFLASSSGGLGGAGGQNNNIKIWNMSSNALHRTISGTDGEIYAMNSLAWSADDRLAVGLENGTIAFYGSPITSAAPSSFVAGHMGAVKAVDWRTGTEQVASGSSDARLKGWNASSGAGTFVGERGANTIHGLAYSPSGSTIATCSGNSGQFRKFEYHIYCAVSTNGGRTFPIQTRVDSVGALEASGPRVDVGYDGTIAVAWSDSRKSESPNIYFANSTDGGANFGDDLKISSGAGRKYDPAMRLDGAGVAHMAWHDERDKLTTERFDIYYGKSTAPGANVRVNMTNATMMQQSATIAVSQDGSTVAIGWAQILTVIAGEIVHDYFWMKCAKSTDGGASFAVPDDVAGQPGGSRWTPSLWMQRGDIFMVWNDYREGSADVYYGSTKLTDTWAPTVLRVQPKPGTANVSIYTAIQVYFSEPMDLASVKASSSVAGGGTTWSGATLAASSNLYGDIVTLAPSGELMKYMTTYTVTVGTGARDISNNNMASAYSWSYKVGTDTDAPQIKFNQGVYETAYDTNTSFSASVTDYTAVGGVRLYYRAVGATTFTAIAMSKKSSTDYQGTIPAQWKMGAVAFYFWANDTFNNDGTNPAVLNDSNYYKLEVIDMYAPHIDVQFVQYANLSAATLIRARVTDGLGVKAVYLEHTKIANDTWTVKNMTSVGANNYTAEIPGQIDTGTLNYRVVASDVSNNTGISQTFALVVRDLVPPTIFTPEAVQQSDESILVSVNVVDNHEVGTVTLHFIPVGGSRYIEKEMILESSGKYTATVLKQEQTGTFKYYVNASDVSGNSASTLWLNEDKPYKMYVEGSLPPLSIILVVSIAIIVVGLVVLIWLLKKKGFIMKGKKELPKETEKPMEKAEPPKKPPVRKEEGKPGKGQGK